MPKEKLTQPICPACGRKYIYTRMDGSQKCRLCGAVKMPDGTIIMPQGTKEK